MRLVSPLWVAALCACSSSGGGATKEICNNGLDDDMNGAVDCADAACMSDPMCQSVDSGNWGTCPKCGITCSKQSQCVATNVLDERPLAICTTGKCQQLNQTVQVRIEYDTSAWNGLPGSALGSVSTRWISKKAVDGSAVTCATIEAVATSDMDPGQLEASGQFNVLGYDVTAQRLQTIPKPFVVPYSFPGSGSDYLIWSEPWSGLPNANPPHVPTGKRYKTKCIESGPEVTPLTSADDCSGDAGTSCRTVHLVLPPAM